MSCTFYQPQFLYIASTPVKLIDYSWLVSVISTRQWDHLASVETVLEKAAVLSLLEVCPQVCLFSCILCGQGGGAGVFHCWAISSSLLNEFSFKRSTGFSFVVLLFLLLLLWFTVHIAVFKNCSSDFTELVLWFLLLRFWAFLHLGVLTMGWDSLQEELQYIQLWGSAGALWLQPDTFQALTGSGTKRM